jgi:hypothetical protein
VLEDLDEAYNVCEEAFATWQDARNKMTELARARGFYPVVALTPQGQVPGTALRQQHGKSKGGKSKSKSGKSKAVGLLAEEPQRFRAPVPQQQPLSRPSLGRGAQRAEACSSTGLDSRECEQAGCTRRPTTEQP